MLELGGQQAVDELTFDVLDRARDRAIDVAQSTFEQRLKVMLTELLFIEGDLEAQPRGDRQRYQHDEQKDGDLTGTHEPGCSFE